MNSAGGIAGIIILSLKRMGRGPKTASFLTEVGREAVGRGLPPADGVALGETPRGDFRHLPNDTPSEISGHNGYAGIRHCERAQNFPRPLSSQLSSSALRLLGHTDSLAAQLLLLPKASSSAVALLRGRPNTVTHNLCLPNAECGKQGGL